jgi:ketosteroid isomerase-like protein
VNFPTTTTPGKSLLIPCLRCIPFFVLAAILAPIFLSNAQPVPQGKTLATLADAREAWVRDLHDKQLDPILKFYAPEAAFLQPNGERITGTAALRKLFQNIMATFDSDLTLHSLSLETSADLAYDSGEFVETLTNIATKAKISSKGSYVIIYKREDGGAWQIVQHVWTGTPPAGT